MPRIPYLPADIAEPAELVAAIRRRRGGELINLDRLLLYSPPVAAGWNHLLGAVRRELQLSPFLREVAMCVVAVLNGAEYEFVHHAPELIAAGGTKEQVQALRNPEHAAEDATLFDPLTLDAIRLTVSLTRDVSADDALMKRLRDRLGDRELFELVTTIAAYNMVSRMIVALQIEPENH